MFDKFTHDASRVIFFARYEAGEAGSSTIETEHLLMALFRPGSLKLASRFLKDVSQAGSIRSAAESRIVNRGPVPRAVDLPLSKECKDILHHALNEATALNHPSVGPEHLLLGLLRESNSVGATILHEYGLDEEKIRKELSIGARPVSDDGVSS